MAVMNEFEELTADAVKEALTEWFRVRQVSSVRFDQNQNPENEQGYDYFVTYEAIFEPHSLRMARVEVWVTREGYISIGFEKQSRIAERIGVRSFGDRFIAGHEPIKISESGLIAILNVIADGRISIRPTVIPFFGLISSKAVIGKKTIDFLRSNGYKNIGWLDVVSDEEFNGNGKFLDFIKW